MSVESDKPQDDSCGDVFLNGAPSTPSIPRRKVTPTFRFQGCLHVTLDVFIQKTN